MLLGGWERSATKRVKVYAIANAIVQACRQPDPYEPNGAPRSVGDDGVGRSLNLLWYNNFWSIGDFLRLLYEAELRQLRLSELRAEYRDAMHFTDIAKEKEIESLMNGVDTHMKRISEWSCEHRDAALIFLIFLSIHVDTRAERACYKYSNVYERHHLIAPKRIEIRSLRLHLAEILDAYLNDLLGHTDFRRALNALRIMGSVSLPDTAGPPVCSLFQVDLHNKTADGYRIIALSDRPNDEPSDDSAIHDLQFPMDLDVV